MSQFCVSEGTMITLKDKTSKPIEEIIIGEELLVFDLETLQKSQKYDILVKLSTNDFHGIFQDSIVKNIWTNTSEKYYLINKKLKITGDHILLANRGDKYYWTKVDKLQLNDLLFTEMNIFEYIHSIEIINEKIDVFNLEVNTYYNYFANSYLIHNGAPCSACDACGSQTFYFYAQSNSNVVLTGENYSSLVGSAPPVYSGGNFLGGSLTSPNINILKVPHGFNFVKFEVWGADGGASASNVSHTKGRGVYIKGVFKISSTADLWLVIAVGENSQDTAGIGTSFTTFNGGGAGGNRNTTQYDGFNGGGSTHIGFLTSAPSNDSNYTTPSGQRQLRNWEKNYNLTRWSETGTLPDDIEDYHTDRKNIIVIAAGGGGQASTGSSTDSTSPYQMGGNGGAPSSWPTVPSPSGTRAIADFGYWFVGVDGSDGPNDPNRMGGHGGGYGGSVYDAEDTKIGGPGVHQPSDWDAHFGLVANDERILSKICGTFGAGGFWNGGSATANASVVTGLNPKDNAHQNTVPETTDSGLSGFANLPVEAAGSAWQGGGGGGGYFGGAGGSAAGGGGGGGSSYIKGNYYHSNFSVYGTVFDPAIADDLDIITTASLSHADQNLIHIDNFEIRGGTSKSQSISSSNLTLTDDIGNSDRKGSGAAKLTFFNL